VVVEKFYVVVVLGPVVSDPDQLSLPHGHHLRKQRGGDASDLKSSAHRARAGHVIPSAVSSPHDQRAHGLPQDLEGSEEWSADPPAATGAILHQQADKNLLEELARRIQCELAPGT
jgi:hypothetical protein